MMKGYEMKNTLVAVAALVLYANEATAEQTFVEVPVMNSVPIQQTSEIRTPVENCAYRLVPVDEKGNDSLLLPIIGGIVGGFAGSNIGAGNGQLAATALGAIIGVGAGHAGQRYSPPSQQPYENRKVCETSYNIQHQTSIVGYMVTYNFEGQTYTTRMQSAPGNTIRLMLNTTHTVQ